MWQSRSLSLTAIICAILPTVASPAVARQRTGEESPGACVACHVSSGEVSYPQVEPGLPRRGIHRAFVCVDCHRGLTATHGPDLPPVDCADCHGVRAEGETLQQILGRCNGCHRDGGIEPLPVDRGFLEREVSLRRRSDSLIVLLNQQRAELDRLNRLGLLEENMQRLHSEAERDLDVVLRGRAHHNFAAAAAILEKTEGTVSRLRGLIEAAR